jgi:hypothetical protein
MMGSKTDRWPEATSWRAPSAVSNPPERHPPSLFTLLKRLRSLEIFSADLQRTR